MSIFLYELPATTVTYQSVHTNSDTMHRCAWRFFLIIPLQNNLEHLQCSTKTYWTGEVHNSYIHTISFTDTHYCYSHQLKKVISKADLAVIEIRYKWFQYWESSSLSKRAHPCPSQLSPSNQQTLKLRCTVLESGMQREKNRCLLVSRMQGCNPKNTWLLLLTLSSRISAFQISDAQACTLLPSSQYINYTCHWCNFN